MKMLELARTSPLRPLWAGLMPALERGRRRLRALSEVLRVPAPGASRTGLIVEYPVVPGNRGFNAAVARILERSREEYRRRLEITAGLIPDLGKIGSAPGDPVWVNGWYPAFDAAILYSMLVQEKPALVIEIGSGYSTRFARRAIEDYRLATKLVSIDPNPRTEIGSLCDEVIPKPVEEVGLEIFARLQAGDILFIDSSHVVLPGSDVTILMLEVLPSLAPGVIVHLHDINWPYDYPQPERYFSEQYLLGAFLLAEGPHIKPLMANYFVSGDAELRELLSQLWEQPNLKGAQRRGASFWFVKQSPPQSAPAG